MKEFIINQNDAGQRLDKFITKAFPQLAKGVMYKAIRTKNIKLNGKRCEISTQLSCGDVLRIFIKDDLLGQTRQTVKYNFSCASSIDQNDIIYEDQNIILINKKPGVIVHSDSQNSGDTLVDRLKKYLFEKNEYIPENESTFSPAICNRLDRNTAGIVIGAKNAQALREVNSKIKNNSITKKYLCLSAFTPPKNQDTITAYHCKDCTTNTVKIRSTPSEGYKEIITKYKVIKKIGDLFLIEVELVTGRTHQIRAHLSYIGYPIVGDTKYGDKTINQKYNFKYQTLCAYVIEFDNTEENNLLSYIEGRKFRIDSVWFADRDC